jgi:hypothetical protein
VRYQLRRVGSIVLGLIFGATTILLVRYAAGPDDYYGSSGVSRWEHAGRWGADAFFVGALIVSAAAAVAMLAGGLGWRRWKLPAGIVATLAALIAFVVAWFAINGGH